MYGRLKTLRVFLIFIGVIVDSMEIFVTYLKVFVFGGLFCLIAQLIIDRTRLTAARILVGYVVLGVLLTAVGVYGPFVSFAKSGATIPLTGFGYALARGVQKAVAEHGLLGALTGGLTGGAGGIAAAILFGWLFALFAESRERK